MTREWEAAPEQPYSGFFADYHNVRVGVAGLREVDGLQPEQAQGWREMSTNDRLAALQQAEDRMARVQGRPVERVFGESMGPFLCGYYIGSGSGKGIYVNSDKLNDRAESVNTVVHEGRHAYQSHAAATHGHHPERPGLPGHEDNKEWRLNSAEYKTIERDGPREYAMQPMEADSGGFGFAVTCGLYPDYKPSPDRIDQYNAETAHRKYGMLKLGPESQRFTAADPAGVDQQALYPAQRIAASRLAAQCAPRRCNEPAPTTTNAEPGPQTQPTRTNRRGAPVPSPNPAGAPGQHQSGNLQKRSPDKVTHHDAKHGAAPQRSHGKSHQGSDACDIVTDSANRAAKEDIVSARQRSSEGRDSIQPRTPQRGMG